MRTTRSIQRARWTNQVIIREDRRYAFHYCKAPAVQRLLLLTRSAGTKKRGIKMDILQILNQGFIFLSVSSCFFITVVSASHPFVDRMIMRRSRVFVVPLVLYMLNEFQYFDEFSTDLAFWIIESMLLLLILFTLSERARILENAVIAFFMMPVAVASLMTLIHTYGAEFLLQVPPEHYFWTLLVPLGLIYMMIKRKKRQPTLFFLGTLLIVGSYSVQFFNGSLYVPELSIALRMGTYLLWTLHFSLLLRSDQLASRQSLSDMQNKIVQSAAGQTGSRSTTDHQILRNAKKDPLTGVYNRISIMDIIDDRIKRKKDKPFAILMFDIDKLKQMNEQYGRGTGDSVLTHVAESTSAALRREDRLGRYGEDEFIMMMPNADLTTAEIIAERLRVLVHETSEPACTISVGIALYPKDGITVLQLIKQAELGLNASKSKGGNKVSHKPIF